MDINDKGGRDEAKKIFESLADLEATLGNLLFMPGREVKASLEIRVGFLTRNFGIPDPTFPDPIWRSEVPTFELGRAGNPTLFEIQN